MKKNIAKRKVEVKQKKRVSIIGTLILIISAVALITGCLQPNGGTITQNIVEFDSARVTCTKTNSYPYTNINTGDPIQENDKLQFKAILPAGKIVQNWYINDVKQEDKTDSLMSYTVKASDIAGGRLKVRFDTKDPVQKTIEFDSTRVTCTKTNTDPYTNINNGDQIQENDRLLFQAILPPGKIVKNWYINDVKQEDETDSLMSYTVKASDIAGGKLKVRFDTKDVVRKPIEFDSTRVTCTKTNTDPYTNINNGDQIQENDRLLFQAILPPGKIVKNWYINDVKQEDETDSTMLYTVKASDFVSGKLKVGFDTKDPVQGTVEFDSTRVKCTNTNSYTNINNGAPIQENDKLRFEAILPPGKIVENWYINDVKKKYETDPWMRYTVKASDFKSGKIKISVVFK